MILSSIVIGLMIYPMASQALMKFFSGVLKSHGFTFPLDQGMSLTLFPLIFIMIVLFFLFFTKLFGVAIKTNKWLSKTMMAVIQYDHPAIDRFIAERKVNVQVVKDHRPLACSYGFLNSKILISTGLIDLIDDDELISVLEHEYWHCQNKDPLKMLLSYAITDALFFIPVLRQFRDRYFLEKELNADRLAIASVGVRPVVSALYKIMMADDSGNPKQMAVGLNEMGAARIEALVSGRVIKKQISAWHWVLSGFSMMVIVMLIVNFFSSMTFIPMMMNH